MAIYCDISCAPPAVTAVGAAGCQPVLRNKAINKLVFIRCDADTATLIPVSGEGGVTAADVITNLADLYNNGTNATAFVSPGGLQDSIETADQTEVPLTSCGTSAFVDGALTVTMTFKYGWDTTPVATSPAVDEYPEDVFWKSVGNYPNSWNLGFVTCDGDLGYFMTKDESTFAKGVVAVKEVNPEDINGCLKLSAKQVTLTFKCGASMKRIATLKDPDHDELIAWA